MFEAYITTLSSVNLFLTLIDEAEKKCSCYLAVINQTMNSVFPSNFSPVSFVLTA